MARPIPADFLPAQPPADAQCHRIDFTRSDPPLPEYKDLCAAVIDNALTKKECDELLRLAEASTVPTGDRTAEPVWERAMINLGNGKQALAVDTRNCGRIIYDSPFLADKLLARLKPFLQELGIETIDNQPRVTGLAGRNGLYRLTRLNERLRFLKYEGGEYFRPHWDGHYRTPEGSETSYYTVHLYLNGDGEQDRAELMREMKRADKGEGAVNLDMKGPLLGGATSFLPRFEERERHLRIFPRTGSVLVFQQNDLLHGGDTVLRGVKFTMRTDLMYRRDR
ncbi:uncharacterized protein BP01DRAFT_291758 [Aspergillus saccharolyticus JOP 1030-1]|uniref:Prolyl 4-hydroxylase alpha subunit domain-containing protein n=1 Tax=Aspergillus saccharolyticus JOP 1030-1 TaxID=1450539 RepID=A0A318ZLK1_9EURO|nr:hypothetical protein BP01DRAFT_291758 [Aspergillus saccharolyticus JOP 1030-1]PYH47314.1 hypothetical protein BP01DRAFT_291758 [Aspergillus saccharolyticus JOP 1030-1]